MTRRLVRIMQDRTAEGYVFRTDLRLRPDPGSTPLAIPLEAALHYYESRGQNWERAALIKPCQLQGISTPETSSSATFHHSFGANILITPRLPMFIPSRGKSMRSKGTEKLPFMATT